MIPKSLHGDAVSAVYVVTRTRDGAREYLTHGPYQSFFQPDAARAARFSWRHVAEDRASEFEGAAVDEYRAEGGAGGAQAKVVRP